MKTYKEKIVYLSYLLMLIKQYSIKELEEILQLKTLEELLGTSEIANREWEKETFPLQQSFTRFLDIHIEIFEKILKELDKKK